MVFYYTEDEGLLHKDDVFYYNGKYYSLDGLKQQLITDGKKIPNKYGVNE